MMHAHQQDVLTLGLPIKTNLQWRPGAEVERAHGSCAQLFRELLLRPLLGVDLVQDGTWRCLNPLAHLSAEDMEGGAQGGMRGDKTSECRIQSRHIEPAVEPRRPAEIVGRAMLRDLPKEPEAALAMRQ